MKIVRVDYYQGIMAMTFKKHFRKKWIQNKPIHIVFRIKSYPINHNFLKTRYNLSIVVNLNNILFSLQEAIEEVDRDNSHTLDFFEYLLVVDKITKKSGKTLFKYNNISSKLCV